MEKRHIGKASDINMSEHDQVKFEIATDIARQIRERKNDISGNFLWIALQARQLKEDGAWKAVSESWDSFCMDTEVGLDMSPSYVRNLIDVVKIYVEPKMITAEEAVKIGPHKLQMSKAAVKKIAVADHSKAKEILMSDGKIADIKRDLRELVPEKDRKPLDGEEKFLRAMSKAWSLCNEIEMADVSDDFIERTQDYLAEFAGYLRR